MKIEISKLIDDRNESLWNEIISTYNVEILASPNQEYACFSISKNVIFYVPQSNYCPDSFTHELLHVYLRLKEVLIGSNLKFIIARSNVLSRIFNNNLLEHIGNCLDHIKMLPIYLNLGFNREKFLFDYYENKCTERELSDIKAYYKDGDRFNTNAVELYIGKYFAIKADPNIEFDYEGCLLKLKKIDEKLFLVLEGFVSSWIKYDLENKDIFNDYHKLTDKFYEGLKLWMTKKQFN